MSHKRTVWLKAIALELYGGAYKKIAVLPTGQHFSPWRALVRLYRKNPRYWQKKMREASVHANLQNQPMFAKLVFPPMQELIVRDGGAGDVTRVRLSAPKQAAPKRSSFLSRILAPPHVSQPGR